MKKRIWFSLRTLKIHEFNKTLRYIRNSGETWPQIYARLTQLQQESIAKALKAFSTPIFFYALLKSLGDTTQVSITFREATVAAPSGIITMVASAALILVLMFLQSAFMAIVLRSKEVAKIRMVGFSTEAYGFYTGNDELGLVLPIAPYGSLGPAHPVNGILTSLILALVVITIIVPIGAVGVYLVNFQYQILITSDNGILNYVGASFGLICICTALAYIVFFNIPLPYKKNSNYIRWGFLHLVSNSYPHPRVKDWISKP